jgi:hypothetical protein
MADRFLPFVFGWTASVGCKIAHFTPKRRPLQSGDLADRLWLSPPRFASFAHPAAGAASRSNDVRFS